MDDLLHTIAFRVIIVEKKSLQKTAYLAIRGKIINCEYPSGCMLNEEALRDELNMSRTPVREAISRLEQEGLVSVKPKKGILVLPLSLEDINNIFEIRKIFETYALSTYGRIISDGQYYQIYDRLKTPYSGEDIEEFFRLDDDFHDLIMSPINNKYILQACSTIHAQNRRLRVLSGIMNDSRMEETRHEHMEIIGLCLKHEWEKAASKLADHLMNAKKAAFHQFLSCKK